MPQPTLELPDLPQDWQHPPPADTPPAMPDGVASSGGGLLSGLPMPAQWSLANSSLNAFVPPDVMKTIDFDGMGTPDTPPWLENSAGAAQPQPPQPDDGGFYTGLAPLTPDPEARRLFQSSINGHGYVPQPDDSNPLARIIYAESSNTPSDMPAMGWAVVNRVGDSEFGKTLDAVIHQKNAFQSVQDNSGQWQKSADPQGLTGPNATAWQNAQDTAQGILGGAIPDPVNGAAYFFTSPKYNGDPASAPRDFQRMLGHDLIAPVYPPRNTGTNNYFFNRNLYSSK